MLLLHEYGMIQFDLLDIISKILSIVNIPILPTTVKFDRDIQGNTRIEELDKTLFKENGGSKLSCSFDSGF